MSKVNCPCGTQISDVCEGNKSYAIRDTDIEEEDENGIKKCITDVIIQGYDIWHCYNCGRIAIGNNEDRGIKWYKPE